MSFHPEGNSTSKQGGLGAVRQTGTCLGPTEDSRQTTAGNPAFTKRQVQSGCEGWTKLPAEDCSGQSHTLYIRATTSPTGQVCSMHFELHFCPINLGGRDGASNLRSGQHFLRVIINPCFCPSPMFTHKLLKSRKMADVVIHRPMFMHKSSWSPLPAHSGFGLDTNPLRTLKTAV